jgi:ribonuclease BN (tRNA processing enzyme)
MHFEVLGFAGAAPLQGACPAYVVAGERGVVLLDCGPGALERIWRGGWLARLDAIVISHMHADHVLDLVPFAGEVVRSLLGRRIALHVPARDGLGRLDAAFPRGMPRFEAAFHVHEYGAGDRLEIGDLGLSFAPTTHAQPCFAARVGDGASVIVYGADGAPPDAFAAGADLLVLEATFADDEAAAREHGHMTAGQAGELAARASAGTLLLTHLLPGTEDLVRNAERAFAGPVHLAREGWAWP